MYAINKDFNMNINVWLRTIHWFVTVKRLHLVSILVNVSKKTMDILVNLSTTVKSLIIMIQVIIISV